MTYLARELGVWHYANPPTVSRAPLGGLFDFRLAAPAAPATYLDVWLGAPARARCEEQALSAGGWRLAAGGASTSSCPMARLQRLSVIPRPGSRDP